MAGSGMKSKSAARRDARRSVRTSSDGGDGREVQVEAAAESAVPSSRPLQGRVIAVANQKGGVGKSTTAVSLGAALTEMGQEVLVVDLDPQGNASTGLGIRHLAREVTTYEVLLAEAS